MTLPIDRHLTHVTEQRIQKLRPAKFRAVLPVDNSVPRWATSVETSRVEFSGSEPIPVGSGSVKNAPRPTLDRVTGLVRVLNFAQAYDYTTIELERAEQTGVMLPATKALANQRNNEALFDKIAAGGHLATYGLPGLLNIAGKVADTVGTAWASATVEQILSDIGNLIGTIKSNTLENYLCDTLVFPDTTMTTLTTVYHSVTGRSALSYIRENYPGVTLLEWHRCAGAGGAGADRVVAMARDPEVARIIITRELTDEPVSYSSGMYEIVQFSGTAGVLVEVPEAVSYLDGM